MPWKETDVMTEKERFVILAQTGRFTLNGEGVISLLLWSQYVSGKQLR